MKMFGKNLFALVLNTLALTQTVFGQQQAPSARTNSVSFQLRGRTGNSIPKEDPETVDILWTSASGTTVEFMKKVALDTQWRNFTINFRPNETASFVTVRYLNDKVITYKNVIYDYNVHLDTSTFLRNGVSIDNLNQRLQGGTVFEHFKKLDDVLRLNDTVSGSFKWSGTYNIDLTDKPSTANCDDPKSKNIICFKLTGDIGFSLPGNEERVDISYMTTGNKLQRVYTNYPLQVEGERFMVQATENVPIQRIVISFKNDRVWTYGGIERDRNVRFDVRSVEINHTKVPFSAPYIGGPIVNRFSGKDYKRLGLAQAGIFAWEGDYHLNIPTQAELKTSLSATNSITDDTIAGSSVDDSVAKTDGDFGSSNGKDFSFALRGKHVKYNNTHPEYVRVTYKTSSGAHFVAYDDFPLADYWHTFKVAHPTENISSVLVNLLNGNDLSTSSSPNGVEFGLETVKLNGEEMYNKNPCYSSVPMKKGRLLINVF